MTKEKFDYYKAPSLFIFEDIKRNAIKIWEEYDDTYGYATEKINRIKDLKNISDNAWYIVSMFDFNNQHKLLNLVSEEAKKMIKILI